MWCLLITNNMLSPTCFFFQAEDGIRDADVTGVQTCALPILAVALGPALHERQPLQSALHAHPRALAPARSEERRVGKECRSRWSPYHYKKTSNKKQRQRRRKVCRAGVHTDFAKKDTIGTFLCVNSVGLVLGCFFSSRRRHTRCGRDWSSDVCSSDLEGGICDGGACDEESQVEAGQPFF